MALDPSQGVIVAAAMVGVPIALLIFVLYKKLAPAKTLQPDYLEVFKDRAIKDEALNIPDRYYGVKELYRGGVKLGDILTFSHNYIRVLKRDPKLKSEMQTDQNSDMGDSNRETIEVFTVVFKAKRSNVPVIGKFFSQEVIMKFTEENRYNIANGVLTFPENVSFTAMGKVYMPMESYPKLSRIVNDDFNKRFWEVGAQSYASTMTSISAQTPEMSHELALKRMEIIAAREQKQQRFSTMA